MVAVAAACAPTRIRSTTTAATAVPPPDPVPRWPTGAPRRLSGSRRVAVAAGRGPQRPPAAVRSLSLRSLSTLLLLLWLPWRRRRPDGGGEGGGGGSSGSSSTTSCTCSTRPPRRRLLDHARRYFIQPRRGHWVRPPRYCEHRSLTVSTDSSVRTLNGHLHHVPRRRPPPPAPPPR